MALYLNMTKLSPPAAKALLEQGLSKRAAELAQQMEAAGGRLVGYYLADGNEWDVVALLEVPDEFVDGALVGLNLRSWSTGQHQNFRNIRLQTPERVEATAVMTSPVRPLVDN